MNLSIQIFSRLQSGSSSKTGSGEGARCSTEAMLKPISYIVNRRSGEVMDLWARVMKPAAVSDESKAKKEGEESWGQLDDDEYEKVLPPLDNILDLEAAREVALFQAAARNDVASGSFLIKQGAVVNCQDSDNLCTALHVACGYGHLGVAELLVRGGADMEIVNRNGQKPADLAKQNGFRDVVLILNLLCHDLC